MDENILDCPDYGPQDEALYHQISFWVEGIAQTTVAVLGILFNTATTIVLQEKEMINSFNLMLIVLCSLDSSYLVSSVLESFRKSFGVVTQLHISLFPKLLYPMHCIVATASIYMTVGMTFERYTSVHQPVNYNWVGLISFS